MAWYDESVFYHIYPLGLSGAPALNDYGETQHRLRDLKPWIFYRLAATLSISARFSNQSDTDMKRPTTISWIAG